ncbi:MAG: nicotinate-nucleotide--dimethylbenzimidazole phosphoribosyltransferase [Clostridia bacterium]|nr:nicotinate-nucleotide--dimethylbenzimidazole phosphoribosyltransferase [Clostridia bacterium]
MKTEELIKITEQIKPACRETMEMAKARQESLAKPPGSLGGLEDISVRIAGMTGKVINSVDRSCVAVFCADNGVCAEGVASAPQSVTMAQTVNFTRRLTGVGALAESFGSELLIVDMGIKDRIPESLYDDIPLRDTHKIVNRRIRPETGETDNIAEGPAMTVEEALRAMKTGIEMADAISAAGYEIMGIGEMGIGNTSTSAALLSSITGRPADETVGRGGGVNDAGFARKKEIVDKASRPWREAGGIKTAEEMTEALAQMGGFDICAMTGAYLGAAKNRMPVVIDGYISVVAALAAYVICPDAGDYMIASHKSFERGYVMAVEMLGLKPFMALDMRLGEGSGCPVAFKIIKGACDVMANMATFEEAAIDDGYLEEIRSEDRFRK